MKVAKITKTKKTVVKCVKLPDDLNSALSYMVDTDIDKRKASHFIRLALVNRYLLKLEETFQVDTIYTKTLPDAYYFHIPKTMDLMMKKEKSQNGMTDQSIIISSLRKVIKFN
jgi:hypothetical protein